MFYSWAIYIRLTKYEISYYNVSIRDLDINIAVDIEEVMELDWNLNYEARDNSLKYLLRSLWTLRWAAANFSLSHLPFLGLKYVTRISFGTLNNFSPSTSSLLKNIIFLSLFGNFWVLMFFGFSFFMVRLWKYRAVFVHKLHLF